MASYDDATKIIGRAFPSMAAANEIVGRAFPSMAAGDRILAGAGLFPRGGRGGKSRGDEKPTAGTSGGLRGGRRPGAVAGPHRTGPRSPAARIVGDDSAAGGVVNINVWAAKLQGAGISAEAIRNAYESAGGDAVLAPAEAAGDTADFLADFVEALEAQGADPATILGTYQQAGGLGG